MKKLGLAVIGLGTASAPHLEALEDLSDSVELRRILVRRPEAAEDAAARFGCAVDTDIDALWRDDGVEAVLILTTPDVHLDQARAAFENGRHVLTEKPLAARLQDAETMVECARRADRRLGVVLQHRMRPSSQRLNALLAEGGLGRIEAASLEVPWWRPQSYYDAPGRGELGRDGGGVLLTQAIHSIDLFCHLLGVPEVLASRVRRTGLHQMETEDHATAIMALSNGATATLTATTAAYPGGTECLRIIGTEGSAVLRGSTLELAWLDGTTEEVSGDTRTGGGASVMDFPSDHHRAIIADFAEAVREGRAPAAPGEAALAPQRLIDAILAADPDWPPASPA